MVVILVGIALSGISIVAASTFFSQNRARSIGLMGDSEALTHWSMLLRQSFKEGKCLKLDDVKPNFLKTLPGGNPYEHSKVGAEETALARKGISRPNETLGYIRNSLPKNYELLKLSIVQRSNVIGEDPGRVVADLKVTIVDKINKTGKKNPTIFNVPMLLDLDETYKSIACMKTPDAKEMCAKNKGKFDENATDKICAMAP